MFNQIELFIEMEMEPDMVACSCSAPEIKCSGLEAKHSSLTAPFPPWSNKIFFRRYLLYMNWQRLIIVVYVLITR